MMTPPIGILVRPATPDDAAALVTHVNAMTLEAADSLPMAPGEFKMTVEQEREFLANVAATENSLYLVAEAAGAIVGALNYSGGQRQATRHAATLGISVRRGHQRQGVGAALLAEAIRRAKATSCLRRLELRVYADNHAAIRLYERLGFVREGVHRNAIRRGDHFIDDLHMAVVW